MPIWHVFSVSAFADDISSTANENTQLESHHAYTPFTPKKAPLKHSNDTECPVGCFPGKAQFSRTPLPPCSAPSASRECSGSGRPHLEVAEKPAMENKCVGSKRNMTDALKRRHVLYQPTLTIRPPKPHLAEAERDLSGPVSHSRRRLLQLGSSSALLGLAARSSQVGSWGSQ